jgi:hypothetical protein
MSSPRRTRSKVVASAAATALTQARARSSKAAPQAVQSEPPSKSVAHEWISPPNTPRVCINRFTRNLTSPLHLKIRLCCMTGELQACQSTCLDSHTHRECHWRPTRPARQGPMRLRYFQVVLALLFASGCRPCADDTTGAFFLACCHWHLD